jgi:ribosomal protein S6--L-glutamate ligase
MARDTLRPRSKTTKKRSTALRTAKRMRLNASGVDMLRLNHGPMGMEVTSSPGLEKVAKATGRDIAGKIMDHIGNRAVPGKTRTKERG